MTGFSLKLTKALAVSVAVMFAGAALSGNLDQSTTTDGLLVYYGLVPAKLLRDFPHSSEEAVAHRRVPVGKNSYHLVVAVFEERGSKRVTDARLTARIRGPGLLGVEKPLEPTVLAGNLAFCNYFTLADHQDYRIEIGIQRPASGKVVTAVFNYAN